MRKRTPDEPRFASSEIVRLKVDAGALLPVTAGPPVSHQTACGTVPRHSADRRIRAIAARSAARCGWRQIIPFRVSL